MLAAFDRAGADTIFVLPNNSNILLTARQAARRATNSVGCGLRSSGHLVIVRSVRLSVFQIRSTAKQMLRFISRLPV